MIVDGRELIFKEAFLTELAAIQHFIDAYAPRKGRRVTSGIMQFALEHIPLNPFAYVEYEPMRTPDASYRRALYQRTYVIVYKVTADQILYLDVYHTRQNPDRVITDE